MSRGVLILLAAIVIVAPGYIAAQSVGSLGAYTDSNGGSHFLLDEPGPCTIYIVHSDAIATRGADFRVPQPSCFTATYLSESTVWPMTTGTAFTGVSVQYGACLNNAIHVLTVNYMCHATTVGCCTSYLQPHPSLGALQLYPCSGDPVQIVSRAFTVGLSAACQSPVEPVTWGEIKAVYASQPN